MRSVGAVVLPPQIWSDVSPLLFTRKLTDDRTDIVIYFARGRHGDKRPFDGQNGTLAHGYYPRFGGDMHFDDDENWAETETKGRASIRVKARPTPAT